jgi:hypothetical protein
MEKFQRAEAEGLTTNGKLSTALQFNMRYETRQSPRVQFHIEAYAKASQERGVIEGESNLLMRPVRAYTNIESSHGVSWCPLTKVNCIDAPLTVERTFYIESN